MSQVVPVGHLNQALLSDEKAVGLFDMALQHTHKAVPQVADTVPKNGCGGRRSGDTSETGSH